MKTMTKLTLTFISVSLLSLSANAEGEASNSSLSFHNALAKSNADYNQLQKKSFDEEFERTSQWGEREHTTIAIDQNNMHADYSEFTEPESGLVLSDRQVSAVKALNKNTFED